MGILKPISKPTFDVRWKFEYSDGTADKYGMWTLPAESLKEFACFQKSNNISKAMIETKDRTTGEIRIAVHCPGQDYCLFKWIGGVRGGFNPFKEINIKQQAEILGLKLVTREVEATVFVSGAPVKVIPRQEEDKKFHYEGFGK